MRKKLVVSVLVSLCAVTINAQEVNTRRYYFIDILNTVILNPSLGFEQYLKGGTNPRSLIFTLSYNVSTSKEMGILIPPSSDLTGMDMGETDFQDDWYGPIFQGPGLKVNFSTGRAKENGSSYFAPGLGFKVLWYNDVLAKSSYYYGNDFPSFPKNTRLQSEITPTLIPELTLGRKWRENGFLFDFFAGIRCSILFRNKTVKEQNIYTFEPGTGLITTTTGPFKLFEVTPKPWITFGLRLGWTR